MQSSTTGVGLSPLERIRQAEAEVTRRLAAARESAEKTIATTQAQATEIKTQAGKEGQRNGEAEFREIIAKAEEESRGIVTQAHHRAEKLRRKGKRHMDLAVRMAFLRLVGAAEAADEKEKDE